MDLKYGGMGQIGFIWLRIGPMTLCFEHDDIPSGSVMCGEYLGLPRKC